MSGSLAKEPQKIRQSGRSGIAEGLNWVEGLSRAEGLNRRAADQNGGAAQQIIAAEEAEQKSSGVTGKTPRLKSGVEQKS
jgi:hypothetical protein